MVVAAYPHCGQIVGIVQSTMVLAWCLGHAVSAGGPPDAETSSRQIRQNACGHNMHKGGHAYTAIPAHAFGGAAKNDCHPTNRGHAHKSR